MTSFFPDVNVWIALSTEDHRHSPEAWSWMESLGANSQLGFSRFTQLGFLRLLTNEIIMGGQVKTLGKAWDAYEAWLDDPRVEFYPEPQGLEAAFRRSTDGFARLSASKWVGDCYLLAYAERCGATLVSFDRKLVKLAREQGHSAILPA